MTFLVILLVMLAAFLVVGWPLVRSSRGGRGEPSGGFRRDDLIGRRDAAYRAIKDLDFEYQLGNLSESDYRGLRKRYRSEAASILRELDAAMVGAGAGEDSPSAPATRAIIGSAVSAQAAPTCLSCGGPTEVGDRYCRSCGASLEAGA